MITIDIHKDGRVAVKADYQWKDLCKGIPGARWNKAARCWLYPTSPHAAAVVIATFATLQCEISVSDEVQQLADLADVGDALKGRTDLEPIPETVFEPWSNQLLGYHLIKEQHATYLAWEMGCGKTKPVVDVVSNLDLAKVLVVAPSSVVAVWPLEFKKHGTRPIKVAALNRGPVKKRAATAKAMFEWQESRTIPGVTIFPVVIVIDYEAIWRSPFAELAMETKWDIIIADEIHRIKSPSGKSSRFMQKLAKACPDAKRVGLSGTPLPHSPLDAYAQFRFLDEGIFGTSFTRFRSQYAIMGGFGGHQVFSFKNQAEMHVKFYSISHRVTKEQILDLPDVTHRTIPVELCPTARRIYRELEDDFIAAVGDGVVTASNALSRLLRLQQVTSGVAKIEGEDRLERIDNSKEKAIVELLADLPSDEPVVVFCRFHADLDAVRRAVAPELVDELSGRVKDIGGKWLHDADARIAAVQIRAGGLGIDLTRSCHVVFYSLGFSLGDYEQALARADRPGQTRPVTIYHLVAQNTVDEKVYRALSDRRDVIESILQDARGDDDE